MTRSLLQHAPGFSLAAIQALLSPSALGGPRLLLDTALHLPLEKKEPSWLLRNSRPVLLEPFLRRAAASCFLRRLQRLLEHNHRLPSSMLAYRRQLSPQHAALARRWLIAHWTACGSDVCVVDWDESNAFCNIPRDDLFRLAEDWCPGLGAWARDYYDSLRICVVTPYGLTQAYQMGHGGGQGDSGGVGLYEVAGILRTNFHRGVILTGLDARDLQPQRLPASSFCLRAPQPPGDFILELCYSDDRRLLASTDDGLARQLDVACQACWAAGGSVNAAKLKVYKLRRQGGRLQYIRGTVYAQVGALSYARGGLSLAGIPLVMGAVPSPILQHTLQRLRLLHRGVVRLRPCFILVLRIVQGYALSKLTYSGFTLHGTPRT